MAFAGHLVRAGAGIEFGEHPVPKSPMNLANFHFVQPAWLWLAILAPLSLALLHRYAARARRQELERMVAPHFAQQLTRSHSQVRRWFKNGLLLAAFALAGFALARPQWGKT